MRRKDTHQTTAAASQLPCTSAAPAHQSSSSSQHPAASGHAAASSSSTCRLTLCTSTSRTAAQALRVLPLQATQLQLAGTASTPAQRSAGAAWTHPQQLPPLQPLLQQQLTGAAAWTQQAPAPSGRAALSSAAAAPTAAATASPLSTPQQHQQPQQRQSWTGAAAWTLRPQLCQTAAQLPATASTSARQHGPAAALAVPCQPSLGSE